MARSPSSGRSAGRSKSGSASRKGSSPRPSARGKVGSGSRAARKFGGKNDFGVPASRSNTEYSRRKSREAKFSPTTSNPSDPRQEIGATQQVRVSGVGQSNAGPGGASSGDIDPDIIGVGTGSGIAQAPADPSRVAGPEWTDGSSNEFASGPPARGENQAAKGRTGGSKRVRGSTVDRTGADQSTRDAPSATPPGAADSQEKPTASGQQQRRRRRGSGT